MFFTGELMYVKTNGRRKEIRRGDSLKDILPAERIASLKKDGLASDVNPFAQQRHIVKSVEPVVESVAESIDEPVVEQTEKSWFGKGKK